MFDYNIRQHFFRTTGIKQSRSETLRPDSSSETL